MTSKILIPDFDVPDYDDVRPAQPTRVDPQVAEAQTRALSALNGLDLDGLSISARPDTDLDERDWIILATPRGLVHVAPVIVGGRAAPSSQDDEDHVAILAAASDLEPLFAALEQAGAADLDPMGVAREPASDGVRLFVEARDGAGDLVHAARLILTEAVALILTAAGSGETLDIAVAAQVELDGPHLAADDFAILVVGDLVLLPRADRDGWAARLRADGAEATAIGRIDLGLGLFIHQRKEAFVVDTLTTGPETGFDLVPSDETPVAVTVSLGQVAIPLSRLTGLRPGATLALPDIGQDMVVTLSSAGRAFARGRLVSLGQTYGVVVDTVSNAG